jgi:hypothetical protein
MEPLTDEEKAEVFRVARNFQDKPKKVIKLIKETVGDDRFDLALEYLKEITQ